MSRTTRQVSLVTFILICLLVQCTEAPFKPNLGEFKFPLAVGNSWAYSFSNTRSFYDSSNPIQITSVDTITGNSVSIVTEEINLQGQALPAYTIETSWNDGLAEGNDIEYYNNLADGFSYLGGSTGLWTGPPKLAVGAYFYEFHGLRAYSLPELINQLLGIARKQPASSIALETLSERPVPEWGYPLEVGHRWVYRDTAYGDPWNMEKMVIGVEKVSVPAGSFNCYVLRWFWDTNLDGEWEDNIDGYDYISPIGTVKRLFYLNGVEAVEYSGQSVDSYNSMLKYELTDYSLINEQSSP